MFAFKGEYFLVYFRGHWTERTIFDQAEQPNAPARLDLGGLEDNQRLISTHPNQKLK
jgi:hypothetical protein